MRSNLYHLLSFMPATEGWEMPRGLEELSKRLISSGKLRVSADHERNFVRHGEMTFSARELTDPALKAATRARAARHVAPAAGPQGVEDLWAYLLAELKKARGISADKETKVARVLVQSAHPAVIALLIASGTEIFVSYAHNVADLMQVHEWQTHGENSGMQATDDASTSVYISAGGDPFFEGEQKTYTTDGFPALARMVVIAGQELGHFADLRRTPRGIVGRYSTDINASRLRADPTARDARITDIRNVARLALLYTQCGLAALRRAEKSVAFYHTRLRYSPPWLFSQLWRFGAWAWCVARCRQHDLLTGFATLPRLRLGEAIDAYLADMAFNLAPEADVYRDPDPLVEEAIAVIEAVARVPQQEHKWGARRVAIAWPGLSAFYNIGIISAASSGAVLPKRLALTPYQKLWVAMRRRLRPRPDYYPS